MYWIFVAAMVVPGPGQDSGVDASAAVVDQTVEQHPSDRQAAKLDRSKDGGPPPPAPGDAHPLWLDPDPFAPANALVASIRKAWLDPINLTFEPSAGWTYQHASKVVDGDPQGRSFIWYGWSGDWTLWNDTEGAGRIVYNAAGNTGLGTSTFPFIGAAEGNPDFLNNILVSNRLALYMLYWEQELCDKALIVRVGKFEDQIFFDKNTIAYDPVTGFMAENFDEQIVMPFPNYAFGANVEWKLSDDVKLRGGVLNAESEGNTSGFDGLATNQLFTKVELDLTVRPQINGETRVGHWRLTPWYNSMENPFGPGHTGGWGICLNMDQEVFDNVSVFGRLGWGENQATRSNFAVSTGFSVDEPFGIKHHHVGLAFQYAKLTAVGRDSVGLAPTPGEQYLVELYWRMELSDSFDAGPVVQVLRDSEAGIDTSVIWGFRTSWSY
jgi:hypothetical protein